MVQGAILGGFAGLQRDFVKFNVAKRGKLCAIGAERFSAQKTSPTWGGVWKCAVLNTESVIFTEFLLCSGVLAAAGPLNMASAAGFFQVSCNKRHNALKEGHDGAVAVVGAALILQRGQRRALPCRVVLIRPSFRHFPQVLAHRAQFLAQEEVVVLERQPVRRMLRLRGGGGVGREIRFAGRRLERRVHHFLFHCLPT